MDDTEKWTLKTHRGTDMFQVQENCLVQPSWKKSIFDKTFKRGKSIVYLFDFGLKTTITPCKLQYGFNEWSSGHFIDSSYVVEIYEQSPHVLI